jgi:RHS repeat-associated protein
VLFPDGTRQHCESGASCLGTDWILGWRAYGSRSNGSVGVSSNQAAWLGNVLEDPHDASGLLYRRNRYYNPQTARFTQEDPIGLAGGMNAYGFANGDPATYSDPYGLKTCQERVQELKNRVQEIRARIQDYLDAAKRGEQDQVHFDAIQREVGGFNDDLNAYHSRSAKCDDDEDDFRPTRNSGLSLVRLPLPAPARPDNPRRRPQGGYHGPRWSPDHSVQPADVEKAGWAGLLVTAGALLAQYWEIPLLAL